MFYSTSIYFHLLKHCRRGSLHSCECGLFSNSADFWLFFTGSPTLVMLAGVCRRHRRL